MSMIEETIAKLAHAGQKYGNGDYFDNHIRRVVFNLPGTAMFLHAKIAFLHDTLEDTALTTGMLVDFGVSQEVIQAVVTLTRTSGESYDAYIERIKADPVATVVKLADLKANIDAGPSVSLLKRYTRAVATLTA